MIYKSIKVYILYTPSINQRVCELSRLCIIFNNYLFIFLKF